MALLDSNTSYVALGLLVFAAAGYVVYQTAFSPLARVPGPFLAKFSQMYLVYFHLSGQSHRILMELHKKHGNVVRTGPSTLSIADPTAFYEMYRAGNKFVKTDARGSTRDEGVTWDMVNETDERIHGENRRLVARAYAMDSMVNLEPMIDELIADLLRKLRELQGQRIDLGHWVQLYAFDIVGSITFSRPFGFVEEGDDNGLFERLQRIFHSIVWVAYAPWVYHINRLILMPLIGSCLALTDQDFYFIDVASKRIREREAQGGNPKDLLGQMLATQQVKPQFLDSHILHMISTNVLAGSDTTSTALRATLWLLCTHPEVLERLRAELTEKMTQDGDMNRTGVWKFAKSEQCPYLQAVLYESLRLFPPAAVTLDRVVPEGGLKAGPHHVPAGTVVGTSPWVIQRMPELWGSDADEFRPERWLDKETESQRQRYFFAFGRGSRFCLGRNVSWIEMEKLIPTLIMNFDVKIEMDGDIVENNAGLLYLDGPFARLSARESV
ncbi:cytochrome P450 [Xylaria bambusicola]|uniref:cytochrome P450 n=1 Tax=Xylaria bambusicola TaxID=326684 RepID=UPI00200809AF|nr:cytochrome P450 [Xylaria bambusicola]KAI0514712.1 cytochrome P450 [Xylaria bambusicola]